MDPIPFYKFSATGNDFILIDTRDEPSLCDGVDFQQLCQRRLSVGADGVLLLEKCPEHDFRMRYFNADGRESEMCGNGARCAAYFVSQTGTDKQVLTFLVGDACYEADITGNEVRLNMPWPQEVLEKPNIVQVDFLTEGGFLNTGVPHFVLYGTTIAGLDVDTLGRKYRSHPRFLPTGTNVDFVEIVSQQCIRLRTFERGVEQETLSCGTGCVASAYLSFLQHKTHLPTEVITSGGTLEVSTQRSGERIFLKGSVKLVYEGRLLNI